MEWAGCAAQLGSAGAEAGAGVNKNVFVRGGGKSGLSKLQGFAVGALGWETLVIHLVQSGSPGFGVRDSPAVWPFIFLSLRCLVSEMRMVITPTSWWCREVKTSAFLWAPCLAPLLQLRRGDQGGQGVVLQT